MILLIWEEVPEATTVFLLRDLTEEEKTKVRKCHNHFINDGNGWVEEVGWLSVYLEERKPEIIFGKDNPDEVRVLLNTPLLEIVVSGFLC